MIHTSKVPNLDLIEIKYEIFCRTWHSGLSISVMLPRRLPLNCVQHLLRDELVVCILLTKQKTQGGGERAADSHKTTM